MYIFPFRIVFFYLVTMGWTFYITLLCVNQVNQSINQEVQIAVSVISVVSVQPERYDRPSETL